MTSDDASPTSLNLESFLPYRLNHLADRISSELERVYAERYGLNVAQWRVLVWLNQREGLTAKEICAATQMDKARVSRAVQALEERGLISRRPSPRDQRLHELRLTEEGRALLAELVPEARAWEAALVTPLDAEEYRELFEVMAKLERQLERLGESAR